MFSLPLFSQQKSAKRGISWAEDAGNVIESPVLMSKVASGVSWMYNWGHAPKNTAAVGPAQDVAFVPMCWNGEFNEVALRNYLSDNPGVKYLLGFNEPNLSWNVGGCQMTPETAAKAWPKVEAVAKDFNLEIVAPALNYSGDRLSDGVVYATPFDWLEAFLKLYPTAHFDYFSLHCYMDYAEAVKWFATDYFYNTDSDHTNDLYSDANRKKYPNLIKYIETYGEKPMFLTEFCAFGNSGFNDNKITLSQAVQIDHMTQKLQYLELSDKVAAYAWFVANGNASQSPYNSIFQSKTTTSDLSELGRVYVYMSSFDKDKYYTIDEKILAKDYIDASTGSQQVKLRSNSDAATAADIPLQVEFLSSAWTKYQIDVPAAGEYQLDLRIKSTSDNTFRVYVDGSKTLTTNIGSTNNLWDNKTMILTLSAGKHSLMLFNASQTSCFVNNLILNQATGINQLHNSDQSSTLYYSIGGERLQIPHKGIIIEEKNNQVKKILR